MSLYGQIAEIDPATNMDAYMIALVMAGGAALGIVVWMLAKVGKALVKVTEALAAVAVFFGVWLVCKAVVCSAMRSTASATCLDQTTRPTQDHDCGQGRFRQGAALVLCLLPEMDSNHQPCD